MVDLMHSVSDVFVSPLSPLGSKPLCLSSFLKSLEKMHKPGLISGGLRYGIEIVWQDLGPQVAHFWSFQTAIISSNYQKGLFSFFFFFENVILLKY